MTTKTKQTAATKKRHARQRAKLAAEGARKCMRCGLYGGVEHDNDVDLCNRCTDMIHAGAPEGHADDDASFDLDKFFY